MLYISKTFPRQFVTFSSVNLHTNTSYDLWHNYSYNFRYKYARIRKLVRAGGNIRANKPQKYPSARLDSFSMSPCALVFLMVSVSHLLTYHQLNYKSNYKFNCNSNCKSNYKSNYKYNYKLNYKSNYKSKLSL